MRITRSGFLTSVSDPKEYQGYGKPEIAMAGKSNVGKSSLINSLTGNGKLARTSAEPGKTRLINLYSVNDTFLLADLPGYGFAKAPKSERDKWARMIEGYLSKCDTLEYVLMLVDIRHEPSEDDAIMVNYLRHYGIPFCVVATKADKLSAAQRSRAVPVICRVLAVQPWEVIPYSSENGTGKENLLKKIDEVLEKCFVMEEEP